MVSEHYHISRSIDDGMVEVTLVHEGDDWVVDDDWGDISGESKRLGTFKTEKEALDFCKQVLENKYPKGKWMSGAGIPDAWNNEHEKRA